MPKKLSLIHQFKLLGLLLILFFFAFATTVILYLVHLEKENEFLSALHVYHALVLEDKNVSTVSQEYGITHIGSGEADALLKNARIILKNTLLQRSLYNGGLQLYYVHQGSLYLIRHDGRETAFINGVPQMRFLLYLLTAIVVFTAALFALVLYLTYLKKTVVHLKTLSNQIISYAASNNIGSARIEKTHEVGEAAKVFYALIEKNATLEQNRHFFIRRFVNELHTLLEKTESFMQRTDIDGEFQNQCKQIVSRQKSTLHELMSLNSLVNESSSLHKSSVEIKSVLDDVAESLFISPSEFELDIVQEHVVSDRDYFTLLMHTLIDNASQYKEAGTLVKVSSRNSRVCIQNSAKPLEKEIEYYLKPIDDEDQDIDGIGLTLVYELALRLGVRIVYSYENNCHSFCVVV